jgi:hypothetical protein
MIFKLLYWTASAISLSLTAILPALSMDANAAENGLKYWASEHFQEAPNIFERRPSDPVEGNPTVVDLGDIDWSYDIDGDVRLCFDNRPIMKTYLGRKITNPKWSQNCRGYTVRLNYKNKSPDNEYVKQVTEGLLVSKAPDGKITCDATFTIASLYSVLQSLTEGHSLADNENLLVFPYFRADGDPFYGYPAIKAYLDERDTFEHIKYSYDHFDADLKYSLSCLLPAYRQYWQQVRDKCFLTVSQGSFSEGDQMYFPLLKLTEPTLRNVAQQCRKN